MQKVTSLLVSLLVLLIAGMTSIQATTVYASNQPHFSGVSRLLNAYGKQLPFGITIKAPDIAENGSVVPVTVTAWGFDNRGEYIRRVQIFSCTRPYKPIVDLRIPHKNFIEYATRIRLRKTEKVYAVAELNSSDRIYAAKQVKVTMGGCGGGYGPSVQAAPASDGNIYNPSTWVRSSLAANRTRLKLRNGLELNPDNARVNVHIDGYMARVVMDLEYSYTRAIQDEGVFSMRLPDGASPYHIAFGENVIAMQGEDDDLAELPGTEHWQLPEDEINTFPRPAAKLKHAIMVPRRQASLAYINTVYRNVDPALVEWQGSGVFSVRVFPLIPGKTHRVVFAYDMPLREVSGSLHYDYVGLDQYARTDMTISITTQQATNIIGATPRPVITDNGARQVLSFNDLRQSVHISLLDRNTPVLHGHDEVAEYFATRVGVEFPQQMLVSDTLRAVFMVDTSLSGQPQSFNDYIKLLQAILRNNEDSIREFAVLYFDVGTRWWRNDFVRNTAVNRSQLMTSLYEQSISGATDLQRAFREATNPIWSHSVINKGKWDVFLLSDGVATWGKTNPVEFDKVIDTNNVAHVYAYVTRDQAVDTSAMHALTEQHGGALFTLQQPDDIESMSRAHRSRAWTLESVHVDGATDVIVKGHPRHIYPGQRITVVGRGHPNVNELVLNMSAAGNKQQVRIRTAETMSSMLAPRMFGQSAVEVLESYQLHNDAAKINYAGHFRIPRNTMSLLMLESDADYARFGISTDPDYASGVRVTRVNRLIQGKKRETLLLPHYRVAPTMEYYARRNETRLIADLCHVPVEGLIHIATIPEMSVNVTRTSLLMDTSSIAALNTPVWLEARVRRQSLDNITNQAEHLFSVGDKHAALRMLSNIVEIEPYNMEQRLVVATSLRGMGLLEEAYYVLRESGLFEGLHAYSPRLNQSLMYAEMAEALQEMGFSRMAMLMYEVEAGYRLRLGQPPSERYRQVLLGMIGKGQSPDMEQFLRERYQQLTGIPSW